VANMVDYVAWRGDFGFAISPWCAIDALLMATLSYLNFYGIGDDRGWTLSEAARIDLLQTEESQTFPNRKRMFQAMAESKRFADCRMHHFIALTDEAREMQFSAMCIDLPDETLCVAFRGTDNTIIGWKEDFNMAYRTLVPGQEAAIHYLKQVAAVTERPLRLTGHSKGGNLAVYAAASVPDELQDRILEIHSFDGPGMNDEMAASRGYERIRGKIRSYIPQGSIIGLLMHYYEPYTVVHSTATGINQHDPMTWEVYGPRFEEAGKLDSSATVVCETLHDWLKTSTADQRGAFVDTLFRYVETTRATRMSDLTGEKWKSLMTMVGNRKELDVEARRVFNRLMAQAITLGFGNVVEHGRNRAFAQRRPLAAEAESREKGAGKGDELHGGKDDELQA